MRGKAQVHILTTGVPNTAIIFTLHQYQLPAPLLFPGNSHMLTSVPSFIRCKLSSALTCNLSSPCKTCLTILACQPQSCVLSLAHTSEKSSFQEFSQAVQLTLLLISLSLAISKLTFLLYSYQSQGYLNYVNQTFPANTISYNQLIPFLLHFVPPGGLGGIKLDEYPIPLA